MSDFIIINDNKIETLVAVTEDEHTSGLMYKAWPPPAMIFPYKTSEIRKFWMRNTISPLDLIFCRDNKVVYICQGVPLSLDLIGPNEPTNLVIELPKGYAKRYSINIGDTINVKYSVKTIARMYEQTLRKVASNEESRSLPENVIEAFKELAYMQRGDPEEIMRSAQVLMGSGVMSYLIEHVGDITNRMSKDLEFKSSGYLNVLEKVESSIATLSSKYGFAKEFEENLLAKAREIGADFETFKNKCYDILYKYSEAHSKLPVYNRAQKLARQAAVSLGRREYNKSLIYLYELKDLLSNESKWWNAVTQFSLDDSGNPIPLG